MNQTMNQSPSPSMMPPSGSAGRSILLLVGLLGVIAVVAVALIIRSNTAPAVPGSTPTASPLAYQTPVPTASPDLDTEIQQNIRSVSPTHSTADIQSDIDNTSTAAIDQELDSVNQAISGF